MSFAPAGVVANESEPHEAPDQGASHAHEPAVHSPLRLHSMSVLQPRVDDKRAAAARLRVEARIRAQARHRSGALAA